MKIPNQEKVWDSIAGRWNEYRTKPSVSVENFLKDKTGRVLDLGCGSGRNLKAFPLKNIDKTEIYALDFSENMLKYLIKNAKKMGLNIKTIHSSSMNIPFENNFFDSAICIAMLHCLKKQDTKKTLKELYRVLKPKSQALISVWSKNSPRLRNKEKECFITWTTEKDKLLEKELRYTYIFELEELRQLLVDLKFKIIKSWEERNINFIVEKK